MSKSAKFIAQTAFSAALLGAMAASPAAAEKLGLGRAALPEEIAAWDLDVSPDGTGLPVGAGTVEDGEVVFSERCAACHGEFAEGVDNWPKLAGGADTLDHEDPLKTVGSYWPHLSTAWDYVNRSMPFGEAQSLEADEVYAIVAYILYSNDLVDDDFVLSNENFAEVELPNAGGFIIDDRAETEYPQWTGEPCMADCKESVEITMRAAVLDVTPEEEGGEPPAATPAVVEAAAEAVEEVAEEVAEAAEEAGEEVAEEAAGAALDMALVEDGEKVFKKCKSCHQVGEGAKNKTGPVLNGIVGQPAGAVEGFKYSKDMAESGLTWDEATLAAFLAKPKDLLKKTKMSFAGLKKDDEIAAVIEYLKSIPAQ